MSDVDGWDWQEQGLAVGRGPAGAFDDRAVFTPEVLAHAGKYYLVYQVVKAVPGTISGNRINRKWLEKDKNQVH